MFGTIRHISVRHTRLILHSSTPSTQTPSMSSFLPLPSLFTYHKHFWQISDDASAIQAPNNRWDMIERLFRISLLSLGLYMRSSTLMFADYKKWYTTVSGNLEWPSRSIHLHLKIYKMCDSCHRRLVQNWLNWQYFQITRTHWMRLASNEQ